MTSEATTGNDDGRLERAHRMQALSDAAEFQALGELIGAAVSYGRSDGNTGYLEALGEAAQKFYEARGGAHDADAELSAALDAR